MPKTGTLSKDDLLEELNGHSFDMQSGRIILKHVGEYLQKNTDAQIIQAVEKSFNKPIKDLAPSMLASLREDFITSCPKEFTWINQWLDATAASEAPGLYHAMAAFVFASHIIGDKRWVDQGFYKVEAPISAILVGPSGSRKNTAIRLAKYLQQPFEDSEHHKIIAEKVTAESLVRSVAHNDEEHALSAIWVAPELGAVLGKQTYLIGMVPTLTRLLDQENFTHETISRDKVKVQNVLFSLIGGTTEEWLINAITPDVIKGGFTSRVLFPTVEGNTRIIWKNPKSASTGVLYEMGEDFRETLGDVMFEMQLSKSAEDYLTNWYAAHRIYSGENKLDTGYHDRKHVHIIRIAMCNATLEGREDISLADVTGAMKFLDYIEGSMMDLFKRLLEPDTQNDARKVIAIVKRNGGTIIRSTLYQKAGEVLSHTKAKEAIEYLKEAGFLEVQNHGGSARYLLKKG